MLVKIEEFNRCLGRVIDWNLVARSFNVNYTASDIDNQTGYIDEEILEAIGGISTKNQKEFLDGLADVFVTVAFKYHMITGLRELVLDQDSYLNFEVTTDERINRATFIGDLGYLLNDNLFNGHDIEDAKFALNGQMECIFSMLHRLTEIDGIDVIALLDEVMDSNWSKFPRFEEGVDYDAQCRWIEATHGRKNVAFSVQTLANGDKHVVFRDNNGAGKISKPECFRQPDLSVFL